MASKTRARAQSVIQEFGHDNAPKIDPKEASNEPAEVNRCLVYCRLRCSFARDFEDEAYQLLTMKGKQVFVKGERDYTFDGSFDAASKQEDVFEIIAKPCLNHAFKGYCSALLCYGQTGTGKSFTMCCTKPGQEGIIPRSAQYIFDYIAQDTKRNYRVVAQFIQIYRDQLGDLMTEGGRDKVDIRFEEGEGVTLPGCTEHELCDKEQFMQFYHEGDARRVVTATAMNPESSRGHTALVLRIASEDAEDETGPQFAGKITFIDLAGYERFSKTGISNANPIMKDEAKTINASLLSLGHVVSALSNGDKHIPWRNAKLTRLLQDSIGGRSRTSIILTVGPSSDHLHESTNTLQFGLRAMAVKVQAKVSVSVDYQKLAAKLQAMLDEKEERINTLEIQVAAHDAERQEMLERHRRDEEVLKQQHEEALEKMASDGLTAERLLQLNEQFKIEAQNLKEQQLEEVEFQEEQYQKDMMVLIAEQKKTQERQKTQERIDNEKTLSEFERQLAEARTGTNTDLERCMALLEARDETLLQRARERVQLEELCKTLIRQVKDLGGQPVPALDFDDTYVDIVQVEEMQTRFEKELESKNNQVLDLRKQVDDLIAASHERVADISNLTERNEQLDSELRKLGVTLQESNTKLQMTKMQMVDAAELDAVRGTMQCDIDFWQSRAQELQRQLYDERENSKRAQQEASDALAAARSAQSLAANPSSVGSFGLSPSASITAGGRTPRMRGKSIVAGTMASPRPTISMGQLEQASSSSVDIVALERMSSRQQLIIETLKREKEELQELLNDATKKDDAAAAASPKPAAPVSTSDDLTIVLEMKDKHIDELLKVIQSKEQLIKDLAKKKDPLLSSNVSFTAGDDKASSVEPYAEVVQGLRHQVALLQQKLLANAKKASSDSTSGDFSELETLRDLIDEKDMDLAVKDELLVKRGQEIDQLTGTVVSLQKQLEEIGEVPCAQLDEEKQSKYDIESSARLADLERHQKELTADLERKEKEKKAASKLVSTLNTERMKEAAMFAAKREELERKLKEAELQQQSRDEETVKRMVELAQQREKEREESENLRYLLSEQTKAMMAAQARAMEEAEEGFFAKLKRKWGKK